MGVRVLHDRTEKKAALYCSTSGTAFGPIFYDDEGVADAGAVAEEFIQWVCLQGKCGRHRATTPCDPRCYDVGNRLQGMVYEFLAERRDELESGSLP